MGQHAFPPGWDEQRVRRVPAHYDEQIEEKAVAEAEAVLAGATPTVMGVPPGLCAGPPGAHCESPRPKVPEQQRPDPGDALHLPASSLP